MSASTDTILERLDNELAACESEEARAALRDKVARRVGLCLEQPMDQIVTTVTVTVVHPAADSPADVADFVESAVMRDCPDRFGLSATVIAGCPVATSTDADDVPTWITVD